MPKRKPKTSDEYLAMPVCGNCRCWKRLDDKDQMPAEDVIGECFRYPPAVFGETEEGHTLQGIPIVEARYHCFEHGPKLN